MVHGVKSLFHAVARLCRLQQRWYRHRRNAVSLQHPGIGWRRPEPTVSNFQGQFHVISANVICNLCKIVASSVCAAVLAMKRLNVRGGVHTQVMIWDDHQNRCIGELSFRAEVKAVKLRRDR
jgi:hypothetical protein